MTNRENRQLLEVATGRIVVARLEVADSFLARGIGLLGRAGLDEGTGMWIEPCNSIHTWFMRFSLDVVFLDAEGRAVRVVKALKPYRICGPVRGARVVVELPAGTITAQNIQEGIHYVQTGIMSKTR